jgi:sirohydrochlorin cobaltochelatase
LPSTSAYLLVSHGSRDPRPSVAIAQLAQLVQQQILDPQSVISDKQTSAIATLAPPILVGTAVLECAPLPLHEQILQFSQRAIAHGIHHIQVVPLFLLPGVHVMEDIPHQVAIAQRHLGQTLTLSISPYLGAHPRLKTLLANRLVQLSADAHILLSHGSRRSGGNLPVEDLALQLGAIPAYWSVAPSLDSRLRELARQRHQQIAILPYFLFAGGITDAIAQTVEKLSQQFPGLHLQLASPLEVNRELANLVIQGAMRSSL